MNEGRAIKDIAQAPKRIEKVALRCWIAGLAFLSITLGSGIAFFWVISGPGEGPDRMFDGLILIPILIFGAVAGLLSALVWLALFLQLRRLKAANAA